MTDPTPICCKHWIENRTLIVDAMQRGFLILSFSYKDSNSMNKVNGINKSHVSQSHNKIQFNQ